MSAVLPCVACGRPTRPSRTSVSDYPGASTRARGKCGPCYRGETVPAIGRQSVEEIEAGLERFLAARRKRQAIHDRERVSA